MTSFPVWLLVSGTVMGVWREGGITRISKVVVFAERCALGDLKVVFAYDLVERVWPTSQRLTGSTMTGSVLESGGSFKMGEKQHTRERELCLRE